ncbi:hypothetical protein CWE09_08345 [Aliidiomarina minuta]|uniref:Spore coat protein U/FanG domain-containing protein n=1 Tax=Aliidiomarina minuta TaxID=880057 RepID=A0A432W9P1_9GAMM|nr:spore coat U domain-containing protein [Aliidiomarina minuta]RUO26696.1 hypothetical protein CWE09_08345 [Aliidiomarina minuta]
MKKIALITAMAAASTLSLAVQAENTADFDITVEIAESCEVSAIPMLFEDVNPNEGVTGDDGNGTLTVTCTNGTDYTIELAYGELTHDTDGTATLAYNLYSDQALAEVWNETEVEAGTGDGLEQTFDVFAGVDADPEILVGTYQGTVAVTVVF